MTDDSRWSPSPLVTDLYELTMAASYLRRGMNDVATFSLFVRDLPDNRGFLVMAGLESCLEFLAGYRFDEGDLDYLRQIGFDSRSIDNFRDLTFTGDVWAVPEGRIIFGGEPLLEVTAPIAEGQLVETFLLNQITFQTSLASKAARCRIAAEGRTLVDFALRRTHGAEAGMAMARSSAIAGFAATSNVAAARRFGLRPTGTMAHSYIQAFPGEIDAFRAYSHDFPDRLTFLVDTYDSIRGVQTAIEVIRTLLHVEGVAIRLDSGDLAALSREVRRILDDAGLQSVSIFASGGLDEYAIQRLVQEGAPIDGFGVGTKIGVSADAPYLESVYKLVEYAGRPVIKLSPGKLTAPGVKQVYRPPDMSGDIVARREEPGPDGYEPLLRPFMQGGRRLGRPGDVAIARVHFEADFALLPQEARDLHTPREPTTTCSETLARFQEQIRSSAASGS